jgi:hypothetical protein
VLIAAGLSALVVLAAGFVYLPVTEYHKLLIRSLEVQMCYASQTRGERLIFFLPLF